ncbi:hypothetical protein LTS18_008378 [Coniosporium uncinatum]|uniref:Uncharacterized protein n=1 Tax=Coniosporium uncinatum TaxID=93489 RepID=A0ACC3D232_9PEZI|nr:hypothetical protein LTS18_008378 [Coniosporium uncinatum]
MSTDPKALPSEGPGLEEPSQDTGPIAEYANLMGLSHQPLLPAHSHTDLTQVSRPYSMISLGSVVHGSPAFPPSVLEKALANPTSSTLSAPQDSPPTSPELETAPPNCSPKSQNPLPAASDTKPTSPGSLSSSDQSANSLDPSSPAYSLDAIERSLPSPAPSVFPSDSDAFVTSTVPGPEYLPFDPADVRIQLDPPIVSRPRVFIPVSALDSIIWHGETSRRARSGTVVDRRPYDNDDGTDEKPFPEWV